MAKRSEPKNPRDRKNVPVKAEDPNERIKFKIEPPFSLYLLIKACEALGSDDDLSEEDKVARIKWLISMVRGIKPTDEIEVMLATQMIATHEAALKCLSLAGLQNQTFEVRDLNLKHAVKLLATYARQVETLDKHRGKGQQKVTVEYVHVESGAQAIVGHVEAGKPKGDQTAADQTGSATPPAKAISYNPGEKLDMEALPEKAKAKPRRRS